MSVTSGPGSHGDYQAALHWLGSVRDGTANPSDGGPYNLEPWQVEVLIGALGPRRVLRDRKQPHLPPHPNGINEREARADEFDRRANRGRNRWF